MTSYGTNSRRAPELISVNVTIPTNPLETRYVLKTVAIRWLVAGLSTMAIACSGTGTSGPVLVPAGPSRSTNPPSFRFIQMADTQFGFFSTPLVLARFGWSWTKDRFERETKNFEKAITAARGLDPAFVVFCGDLVNSWGHAGQAAEFLRIRDQLGDDVPFYVMPGNHDLGNRPTRESLAWYRATFGDDWYAFRHEDFHGIVLNSSLFTAPENLPGEAAAQLLWLERELARARAAEARHLVVFLHYPLFLESADEPDSYSTVPTETRQILLALFSRFGVRAVFAGHAHRNAYAHAGEIEMVTTGSIGRPLGKDPSGFRAVDVYDDRLEHAYYPLDGPDSGG